MKNRFLIALSVTILTAACQQGPTEEQMAKENKTPLNETEIREVVVGNTLYTSGVSNGGTRWEWAGYYSKEGNARGRAWWNGGQNEGEGAWYIKEGLFCSKWGPDEWGNGGENCQKLYKDGREITFIVVEGPGDNGTLTLKEGNPLDL